MQLDDSSYSTSETSPNNVTPLFRRQRMRLQDGQVSGRGLEQRWKNRLGLLLKAEISLHRANRLRAFSLTLIVIATLMLSFSLYTAPVMPPWVITVEISVIVLGILTLPASLYFSKECRRHRDHLSRKFYQSNHEVDYQEDALVLINRSTYTTVTRVLLTDV